MLWALGGQYAPKDILNDFPMFLSGENYLELGFLCIEKLIYYAVFCNVCKIRNRKSVPLKRVLYPDTYPSNIISPGHNQLLYTHGDIKNRPVQRVSVYYVHVIYLI